MSTSKIAVLSDTLSASNENSVVGLRGESRNFSIADFFRKLAILFFAFIIGNPLSLLLIGIGNRLCFRIIDTAFVCYAASEYYRYKYWFKFANPISLVFPTIVGVYFQGGKIGLIFGITSVEKDFSDAKKLAQFMRNVTLVKNLLGLKSFHYSGILPTELAKRSLIAKEYLTERCEIVAKVVLAAERQVREVEGVTGFLPVILLGGKGNVGRKITEGLKQLGQQVYILDIGDIIPDHLKYRRCIVIDVARKGALEEHIENFWEGMLFLNETYPAPNRALINRLKSMKIPSYHVSGVSARAFPSFPGPYSNGVPCCALINDSNLKALVKRL